MLTVGVLRGGPGAEYDISLKSGNAVLQALSKDRYKTVDIFIDKEGTWHRRGIPVQPGSVLRSVDVVFNALHGTYGEDGTVQRILDGTGVPYTGTGAAASWTCMNKAACRNALQELGVKMAGARMLSVNENIQKDITNLFQTLPGPWVIKPVAEGSSVGVSLAKNYNQLVSAISDAFDYGPQVLVEQYIQGREATCGVVDNIRGEEQYALFPVEIITPTEYDLFDFDAKYSGKAQEICPGNFSYQEKGELQRLAKEIHKQLGLRHYSRSDFIVSPHGIYFLEVNTLPGLTEESLLPKSLKAAGIPLSEFLDHLITLAIRRQ